MRESACFASLFADSSSIVMNALSLGFSFSILSIVASTTSKHEISREAMSLERCFIVNLLISSNEPFKKEPTSYYR
jgi:membrane protein CcdC involved in cytochrome C biogenesis